MERIGNGELDFSTSRVSKIVVVSRNAVLDCFSGLRMFLKGMYIYPAGPLKCFMCFCTLWAHVHEMLDLRLKVNIAQ